MLYVFDRRGKTGSDIGLMWQAVPLSGLWKWMVSANLQINLRGSVGRLHTRHNLVRQGRTNAAGPCIRSKNNLPSLQGSSGRSQQIAPSIVLIDACHGCVGLQVHRISLHQLGGQLRHKFVRPKRTCGNIGSSSGAFDRSDLDIFSTG